MVRQMLKDTKNPRLSLLSDLPATKDLSKLLRNDLFNARDSNGAYEIKLYYFIITKGYWRLQEELNFADEHGDENFISYFSLAEDADFVEWYEQQNEYKVRIVKAKGIFCVTDSDREWLKTGLQSINTTRFEVVGTPKNALPYDKYAYEHIKTYEGDEFITVSPVEINIERISLFEPDFQKIASSVEKSKKGSVGEDTKKADIAVYKEVKEYKEANNVTLEQAYEDLSEKIGRTKSAIKSSSNRGKKHVKENQN